MEWALVENVQRSDLNPLEEAAAYRSLMQEYGFTQADVADRMGKSRSAVANTIRLLQLPASVQQAVVNERISAGHARAMLGLSDRADMDACLEAVVTRDLSVRQTEELVKQMQECSPEVPEKMPRRPGWTRWPPTTRPWKIDFEPVWVHVSIWPTIPTAAGDWSFTFSTMTIFSISTSEWSTNRLLMTSCSA